MRTTPLIFALLLSAQFLRAESRSILVEIIQSTDGSPTISIYSEVSAENLRNTSLAKACEVLAKAEQPRDTVNVYLFAPGGIRGDSLLPIFKAILGNPGLALRQLTEIPLDRADGWMKTLKERAQPNPSPSAATPKKEKSLDERVQALEDFLLADDKPEPEKVTSPALMKRALEEFTTKLPNAKKKDSNIKFVAKSLATVSISYTLPGSDKVLEQKINFAYGDHKWNCYWIPESVMKATPSDGPAP